MGRFGRYRGDFYFEEVVGESVIRPAYTDDDGVLFLDVDEDVEVVIDGVVPDGEIHEGTATTAPAFPPATSRT
ncbi:hypothetical protein OG948_34850 (plasmid) [Embleya sp. NBC_00888]|uniref:hypothetical protein n=1 Tax=Embleya sp. NBC_00888 TaxID=2975960 RepID=UPI002F90C908|nr:hypothetical protein OG948_34850 [Embleya sp. NBC_00888]